MKQTNTQRRRGFTLVEIMAVVLILALLMGIAAKNFIGMTDKAKVTTTRATLKELHQTINMFKLDTGRYPTEEEGLYALIEAPTDVDGWTGPYLETIDVPQDAWKNDLVFILNPESGMPFEVVSYGADGKEGGEGYDKDLYSTDVDTD